MNLKAVSKSTSHSANLHLKIFALDFIAIFFVFSALLQTHFSPDTFAAYVDQYNQIYWRISLGRFVHGIVYHILLQCGLGIISHMSAYTLLFMAASAWCAARITLCLCTAAGKQNLNDLVLCNLALLISMINICVLEWYLFPEAMVMYALALLGATEGALLFAQERNLPHQKIIISFILLFIGINSYQAVLGWYITLSLMIILAQNDFLLDRRTFITGCAAVGVGGINAILNQVIVKLFIMSGVIDNSSRHAVFSIHDLPLKIQEILKSQYNFLMNGYQLLPDWFLVAALLSGIVLLFFLHHQNRLLRFVSIIIALGAGYLITLFPHLMSAGVLITPRTMTPFFLILSLLYASISFTNHIPLKRLAGALTVLILLINCFSVSSAISDHMVTVYMDIVEGNAILHEIAQHEEKTGTRIDKICILEDVIEQRGHPRIKKAKMDINPRQMMVEWEREPFLEALAGRDFEFIQIDPQEAEQIVSRRNWNMPDYDEQISFSGNCAYIILY